MATERTSRKRGSTNNNVLLMPAADLVRQQEIAQRAYEIFLSRGGNHGSDFEDWLQAEREVSERRRETEAEAS